MRCELRKLDGDIPAITLFVFNAGITYLFEKNIALLCGCHQKTTSFDRVRGEVTWAKFEVATEIDEVTFEGEEVVPVNKWLRN